MSDISIRCRRPVSKQLKLELYYLNYDETNWFKHSIALEVGFYNASAISGPLFRETPEVHEIGCMM